MPDGLEHFDVFVPLSSDRDFVKLIKYLKGKRKKTVVIAPSDRFSDNLEEAANQVIYLESLEKEISMYNTKKKALLMQGPFTSAWGGSFSHLILLSTFFKKGIKGRLAKSRCSGY